MSHHPGKFCDRRYFDCGDAFNLSSDHMFKG